ncbi:hypothetical protein OFC23_28970, partial [Escherichia coli]|nr:hypothetical protein [Escherichia coli]
AEVNVKFGETIKTVPAATVADAIKAFDREAAKRAIAAKIDGREVDLNAKIEPTDAVLSIEPIAADSREGLEVIRHSAAHLLAAAILDLFP